MPFNGPHKVHHFCAGSSASPPFPFFLSPASVLTLCFSKCHVGGLVPQLLIYVSQILEPSNGVRCKRHRTSSPIDWPSRLTLGTFVPRSLPSRGSLKGPVARTRATKHALDLSEFGGERLLGTSEKDAQLSRFYAGFVQAANRLQPVDRFTPLSAECRTVWI